MPCLGASVGRSSPLPRVGPASRRGVVLVRRMPAQSATFAVFMLQPARVRMLMHWMHCSRSRVHCRRIRQKVCLFVDSFAVRSGQPAPHQSKRLRSLKDTLHIAGPELPAVLQPTRALTQLPQHNLSFCRLSTNCDSAAVFVKLGRSTFGTECELLRSVFNLSTQECDLMPMNV